MFYALFGQKLGEFSCHIRFRKATFPPRNTSAQYCNALFLCHSGYFLGHFLFFKVKNRLIDVICVCNILLFLSDLKSRLLDLGRQLLHPGTHQPNAWGSYFYVIGVIFEVISVIFEVIYVILSGKK